jgi:hypothetical protein
VETVPVRATEVVVWFSVSSLPVEVELMSWMVYSKLGRLSPPLRVSCPTYWWFARPGGDTSGPDKKGKFENGIVKRERSCSMSCGTHFTERLKYPACTSQSS